jgi:dTDP-4-dehydrorhamnose reductase
MADKTILVTGASGDLGRVLCIQAAALGYQVVGAYLTRPERLAALPIKAVEVDLEDRDAVQKTFDECQPDIVIHAAVPAINRPNLRQKIIVAAYNLRACCPRTSRLMMLSTDMVFDGITPPYADDAPLAPRSVYGQAKAEMEQMAEYVVRTSLIYDFMPGNKQVDWMLERVQKGEKIRLFSDEYRNAIWVHNLAEAILDLAENSLFKGILNVAGPESISRLELGWRLLEANNIDPDNHVEAASQANSGRPADLTMDVNKAILLLKTPLLTLEEAFERWQQERPAPPGVTVITGGPAPAS